MVGGRRRADRGKKRRGKARKGGGEEGRKAGREENGALLLTVRECANQETIGGKKYAWGIMAIIWLMLDGALPAFDEKGVHAPCCLLSAQVDTRQSIKAGRRFAVAPVAHVSKI
jgi:hypothetical protein